MNIGDLAREARVPTKTIRYYEEIGLLPPAARGQNGYRTYGSRDIERLTFLRRARDFGFTLDDCRELLALLGNNRRKSADVKALTQDHIKALDAQLKELRALRKQLAELADACAGDEGSDCAILEALAGKH